MIDLPEADIPETNLIKLRSFEQHAKDFPPKGPPGLAYVQAKVVLGAAQYEDTGEIFAYLAATTDCLIYRNNKGAVIGILHYCPERVMWEDCQIERKGAVNIFVRKDRQRRGIGRQLVEEAIRKWPEIDWTDQKYSDAGRALLDNVLNG